MTTSATVNQQCGAIPATLLLVTYNQEKYVGEAVSAALSQTYAPLTVLVSDDASTDKTFEICEALVKGFSGPHTVRLNRNSENMGIVGHIEHCFKMITTEHVVVAAGDDISLPSRVEKLMQHWERHPDVDAIGCGALVISAAGEVQARHNPWRLPSVKKRHGQLTARIIMDAFYLHGAMAAYKMSLYTQYPKIQAGAAEDAVFGVRALLGGGIAFLDEPLVKYRVHEHNLWPKHEERNSSTNEARKLQMVMNSLEQNALDIHHAAANGWIEITGSETLATLIRVRQASLRLCDLLTADNLKFALSCFAWTLLTQLFLIGSLTAKPTKYLNKRFIQSLRGLLRRKIARDARKIN